MHYPAYEKKISKNPYKQMLLLIYAFFMGGENYGSKD
jgi:hypothetical protein